MMVPYYVEAILASKWCPREDSNLRPQDSYHFDFSRRPRTFVVWTVPSPWVQGPLGAAHPVSTPSPDFSGAWLGIGMLKFSEAFPDFEQIDCGVSSRNPQFFRNPVLYPAELRGHTSIPYLRQANLATDWPRNFMVGPQNCGAGVALRREANGNAILLAVSWGCVGVMKVGCVGVKCSEFPPAVIHSNAQTF